MSDEIDQQPQAVGLTIEKLRPLAEPIRQLRAGRRHVLFAGRGTSDNAAQYGRYLIEIAARMRAALAAPSIATRYKTELDLSDTVFITVSQSGRTDEMLETQQWAASRNARTIAITNDAASPLATEADLAMVTMAGEERAVPATKTYTSQLAAIAVLAASLGPGGSPLGQDLSQVPDTLTELLDRHGIDEAVGLLATASSWITVSRGLTYPTALEAALKLEETCLRPVRALSYADLRHGPSAFLDSKTAAVVIAPPDGPLLDGLTRQARDLRSTGVAVVGIGGDDDFRATCNFARPGPRLSELLAPLGLILPAQLIAETMARHLGLDPDRPRGLTKVTQSEPGPSVIAR
jgi:glucosamine--fructose-6-phosphate aminotransferase (isomerizing)